MNKKDFKNLNRYLYETFKNRVRLNENLDIEINYNTRLNSKLEAKIIVPEKFKKNYSEFCDYILTSGVINEIISTLYQFYLKDLTELREHNN
jgi:hypothetical protein